MPSVSTNRSRSKGAALVFGATIIDRAQWFAWAQEAREAARVARGTVALVHSRQMGPDDAIKALDAACSQCARLQRRWDDELPARIGSRAHARPLNDQILDLRAAWGQAGELAKALDPEPAPIIVLSDRRDREKSARRVKALRISKAIKAKFEGVGAPQ